MVPRPARLHHGVAVAGFGGGALVTAPLARILVRDVGLFETFAILGVVYLIMVTGSALFLRNPPEGWQRRSPAFRRSWPRAS